MKKFLILLFIVTLIPVNSNAGMWTYIQATNAKSSANKAKDAIEETQKEVTKLKFEVAELRERIETLIKLMEEKKNEEKEQNKK